MKVLLDIWNSGSCVVIIDWRIPYKTACEMMKEAGVKESYINNKFLDIWVDSDMNIVYFESGEDVVQKLKADIHYLYQENYSKAEALILFSSGTTGKAKGVILSHFAINTNADMILEYMKPQENDCILITKILAHSSTIIGEFLVGLKSRMKIFLS